MQNQSENAVLQDPAASIGCILVNYRSPRDMLESCLVSLFNEIGIPASGETLSPASEIALRVILVDNASGDGVAESLLSAFPQLHIVNMPDNAGFAAAVNRGLDEITEPQVLLLNTDAVLTPGALASMAAALTAASPEVAGVAPKMMSSSHDGIIDAVGTVMPPDGAPFNRGIGQCDLGQYDRSENVAGVCFGAALLRRALFEPAAVGRLYEGYFLYFEDSDWCMRAVSQGYKFLTAPEAVVLHMHSGITRHESLDFKYRLIELNTLKIVTRTFASPWRVLHIVMARKVRLLARTFIRRRFIRANLSTIFTYAVSLPGLLAERRQLKAGRRNSDRKVFAMARGEHAWFDTVAYRPDRCLESLIDTYERLLEHKKDPARGKVLALLYRLRSDAAAGRRPALDDAARQLISGEPTCVRELLAGVTG